MRTTIFLGMLALAVPSAAWGKGVAPSAAIPPAQQPTRSFAGSNSAGPSASTSTPATSFSGSSTVTPAATMATVGSGNTALPPPPPTSVTQSAAEQGVPASPTPQPLATDSNSNGFSPQLNNQIRASSSQNATSLATVQATLAAGGLYSGPIDGINSAVTRAAIARYQELQGLPNTGELDGETVARLNRGAESGSVASNGATSTAGTATSTNGGFATGAAILPAATTSSSVIGGGTSSSAASTAAVGSTPFPLSTQVNMSPFPPAGTTIQP